MTKLPEPYMKQRDFKHGYVTHLLFTEAQMLQFRRDALEEAMKEILWIRQWVQKDEVGGGVVITGVDGFQWSKWIDRVDAMKDAA